MFRVLLVDDSSDDNYFHTRAIRKSKLNVQVDVCLDGRQALDYLRGVGDYKSREGSPGPDLIFLDINMPKVNGWEFMEKYNQLPEAQKSRMVVIMLTTSLDPQDRERAERDTGVHVFLEKPLTSQGFMDLVRQYFPEQNEELGA